MKRVLAVLSSGVAVVFAAACSSGGGGGGGGSGSGTVTGPALGGDTLTVRSAISSAVTLGAGATAGVVILTDASNACAALTAGTQPPNIHYVELEMGDVNGGNLVPPAAAGDYSVWDRQGPPPGAHLVIAQYVKTDALCAPVVRLIGTAGTVTLSAASGTSWSGSGTVVTTAGDLSISFAPAYCAGMAAALTNPTPPTCQ